MFFKKKPKKLIYIFEDSKSYQILLRILLEKRGYKIKIFECASLAIDQLKRDQPCLVLSDINMPNSNGLDFCLTFNSEFSDKFIPFIFISSDDSYENQMKALMLSNHKLLKKPFDTKHILKAIEEVINPNKLMLN